MSDIFISYAREDLEAATRLAAALEGQGWSVFWDRTIPAGKSWREVIGAALADARCVVVLWSRNSLDSAFVIEEADRGLRRRVLVPAFIERVEPPLGFGSIQTADLSEWSGDRQDALVKCFFKDVAAILGPAPVTTVEERAKAEAEAKRKAEEQRRQQAEAEAKREAEEQPRQQAKAKAMMPVRYFAVFYGIVFLVVGIAGFETGLVTMADPSGFGRLFGLFPVNWLHNLVHIAFGIWGLAAYRTFSAARLYARAVAIIYGVLTIMGLIPVLNTVFGLIPLYGHDVWLHALLAIVAAYFGWAPAHQVGGPVATTTTTGRRV